MQYNLSRSKFRQSLNIEWSTGIIGNGLGQIEDPYWVGSGRIFVRYWTDNGYSTPTLVQGPSRQLVTQLTDGLNVKIKYDNGDPYVDDVDAKSAVVSGYYPSQTPPGSIGNGNGATQDQLATLRCAQALDQPSMIVYLNPWVPIINNVAYNFPGDFIDLTDFIPTSGLHSCVVIFVKSDYSTTEVFASDPVPLGDPLTVETDLNDALSQASSGSTPAWAYDIRAGVTTVLDTDTFLDARQLVNVGQNITAGDVSGPASATDNAVARFDGTTGKQIQNSGVIIDDSDNMTVPGILKTQSGKERKTRTVTASGDVTVATTDDIVIVAKTSGAATVVNLPATPTTGVTFEIRDGKGDAATNNITITPASGNINGAATLVLDKNYAAVEVTYNGTEWSAVVSTAGGGSGTVTSVGLDLPSDVFDVTVTPITGSGDLTAVFKTQVANEVFAGPSSGVDAAPTFRSLVSNDIPSLLSAKISDFSSAVSSIISAAIGVTVQAYSAILSTIASLAVTKGNLFVASGTTWDVLNVGSNGQGLVANSTKTDGLYYRDILYPPNFLVNGGFDFNSRISLTPSSYVTYNDGAYGVDNWYVLCESTSCQIAITGTSTTVPTNNSAAFAGKLNNNAGSSKRIGMAQIVENARTLILRGRTVTFQGVLSTNASSQTIRYAILEWDGTADAPTKDVVNNWASGTYTPGNFFISTVAVVATGSITPTVLTPTFFSVSGDVSTSANNLYVFIWTEAQIANNGTLSLTEAQLIDGADPVPWMPLPLPLERLRCQRFLLVWASTSASNIYQIQGHMYSGTHAYFVVRPPVPFIAVPSLVATASDWETTNTGAGVATPTAMAIGATTAEVFLLDVTVTLNIGTAVFLRGKTASDRYLIFTAELGV